MALLQAWNVAEHGTVTASAELIDDGAAIKVSLHANRPSFFGDLLPPGGFNTRVEAVGLGMGRAPLCVLVTGETPGDKALNLLDRSTIQAEGRLIHSNEDVVVESQAALNAGAVHSVGPTHGLVTPKAEVGAEPVEDPFVKAPLTPPPLCNDLTATVFLIGLHYLPAGRHCRPIAMMQDAHLQLGPGEHYFVKPNLIMNHRSKLTGDDVALIFDEDSKMEFKDTSSIDLYGRRRGYYAGFVIATTRDNTNDFVMWTNNVRRLEGVVYVPSAKLLVQDTDNLAEQSAWTVIVADRLQVKGSPVMVINKNYRRSPVPVPQGVGYTGMNARLER